MNSNLHKAKKHKNDEFYTRYEDIAKELQHYSDQFKGKTVLLNCDNPKYSQFWQYFKDNFDTLELEKLVATHYVESGNSCAVELTTSGEVYTELQGSGDFRSAEVVHYLEQADIVVTNPPFSLFREFVAQLLEYDKRFLIIGSLNSVTHKNIWPYMQNYNMWIGHNQGSMPFKVPQGYEPKSGYYVDEHGQGWQVLGNTLWFTNLGDVRRDMELPLDCKYDGNEGDYPKYDNYDAIEVSKVSNIPYDYDGIMGVPITFLGKHNPDQFDIVGCSYEYGRPEGWDSQVSMSPVVGGKNIYKRVFIQRV